MAGVMNHTARQFNLKSVIKEGTSKIRVSVRVAPGFNVIDDEHWKAFVNGKKVDPYVAELQKAKSLSFGSDVDDMEYELEPETKAKSDKKKIVTKKKTKE